jgi:hypothetical protein
MPQVALYKVLEKMVQDDARRFTLAARMRAFWAKTLKEFVLMQREYSLKGSAEKIECPTLVCDNVADAIVGGGRRRSYTRRCGVPKTTCCSPPRKEFVPFAEMGGRQPESPVFCNPGTRFFEATVVRRNGPDLIIRNLPLLTANHFRKALIDALRERYT